MPESKKPYATFPADQSINSLFENEDRQRMEAYMCAQQIAEHVFGHTGVADATKAPTGAQVGAFINELARSLHRTREEFVRNPVQPSATSALDTKRKR